MRGRALESLGARSEPWVRDLIEEAYDSGDRRLQISAVHAMGTSADSQWLPSILDANGDVWKRARLDPKDWDEDGPLIVDR